MALISELILIIALSLSLIVGLWVLLADPKKGSNRIFFIVSLAIFFWILFGFLGLNSENHSLIYLRLNFCIVSLFFLATYYFSSAFPKKIERSKVVDVFITLFGVIFAVLSVFTNLVIAVAEVGPNGVEYFMGSYKLIFYSYVVIATFLIFRNLFRDYRTSKSLRSQILFFVVGAVVYAGINVIFNVILPVLFIENPTRYSNFGDYSAIFFLLFTAYAIVKHRLFDIKVIATEAIVIFLSLALFIMIFVSSSTVEYVVKLLIWIMATYGGWLLIQSVKKEVKQREELEHLTKKLSDANTHLRDLDKMKDDFLSMASHELNTPLAAIEGYLSMILEEGMAGGELPQQTKDYLDRVFKSSVRLAEIVKGLLNVSRIESGRIHLIYAEAQIEEIIKQSVAEIDPKLKEKKHTICVELPADPLPKSWMDVTRITEVVINFLGNAIKYTDDGGHIEVGAKQEKNDLLVWVKDNGRGIPKDKADRVFQKFSQVDVLKDEVKGTGLGMFISQKFIELHKGKIWFESEGEGKGTTFFFTLPISKDKPYDPHEGEGPVLR